MPISGPLTHVDISIGYPEKSIPFYAAFLGALGYRRLEVPHARMAGPESMKLEVAHFPRANP